MKFSLKHAVAAAIAAGGLLASSGAFAAPPTVPAQPAPIPAAGLPFQTASGDPVYVSVWDPITGASVTEYLGLTAGQIGVADLTTNLNFGTLSSFTSQFAGISDKTTLRFEVFSTSTTNNANTVSVYTTSRDAASNALFDATATRPDEVSGSITAANSAINDWTVNRTNSAQVCNKVNPCLGTDFNDPKSFALPAFADNFGGNLTGYGGAAHSSGSVGSSLSFYLLTSDNTDPFAAITSSAKYAGVWSLSALGALSYSVAGGNPVPLPAAVWLLLSGLGGLGVVGRRRSTQAAA